MTHDAAAWLDVFRTKQDETWKVILAWLHAVRFRFMRQILESVNDHTDESGIHYAKLFVCRDGMSELKQGKRSLAQNLYLLTLPSKARSRI
jgi:hypothetical protein